MNPHRPKLLADYAPPPFFVDEVELDIDLREEEALVFSRLALRRNPGRQDRAPLVLDGYELETLSVAIDDVELPPSRYSLTEAALCIEDAPGALKLTTLVRIRPQQNSRLLGLYRAAGGYYTQCEAEGFRAITWFPDRPDVMARYTVTLHADRERFPLLLANGNPAGQGDDPPDGLGRARHWVRWRDPHPKPSYLFAAVAARLDSLYDSFTTRSGRSIELVIHVEPGKVPQCHHAMAALKKAMRWDEEAFGLECDLDQYKIVVVDDFNMGAMENKGLNVFNSKYVLARPELATDVDYENIERVVAHEYFHNWTGNRVTCRDWFQLSLKEGLTVFRDQEFGAAVHHPALSRIREVRALRAAQFPEDAGPMAHPVRPASYVEINNFYTATVYQKGAEVVRMIQTLIGREAFRRGLALYIQRHDGQAVTCDDFVAAMSDAGGMDLEQFKRWYSQAGTPRLKGEARYEANRGQYVLRLRQLLPDQRRKAPQLPYHIPVAAGLVGAQGESLPLMLAGEQGKAEATGNGGAAATRVLSLTRPEQEFVFEHVPQRPIPSLLRGFSAPVILDFPYSDEELAHLMLHDADAVNRWEAGQRLAARIILAATRAITAGEEPQWPALFVAAVRRVIEGCEADPALAAEAITLPSEATLAEELTVLDPGALHAAAKGLRLHLVGELASLLLQCYERFAPAGPYRFEPLAAGRRSLRNACLAYLARRDTPQGRELAYRQFETADNMTDEYAALLALGSCHGDERERALALFYERWQQESLAIDKWLAVQAASDRADTLATVQELTRHPAFDRRNPNKAYALLRSFGTNHASFHAADGSGYRFFVAEIARQDAVNPLVAARLARCFDCYRKLESGRQREARAALAELRATRLSPDVGEIVDRLLG